MHGLASGQEVIDVDLSAGSWQLRYYARTQYHQEIGVGRDAAAFGSNMSSQESGSSKSSQESGSSKSAQESGSSKSGVLEQEKSAQESAPQQSGVPPSTPPFTLQATISALLPFYKNACRKPQDFF
jgi:hypothetical protein